MFSAADPCFDDSTCENTEGGFQCLCPNTTTGHLCQYSTDCLNPNTCANGKSYCFKMLDSDRTLRGLQPKQCVRTGCT